MRPHAFHRRGGSPPPRPQRGGVLIVATVLIFVLSMIGVSTMRGSALERRMATNAVQTSVAFQASESATEALLNDSSNLGTAFALEGEALALEVDLEHDGRIADAIAVEGELRYVGDGAALGYSIGVGSNNFMALRYDARGSAEIASVRSFSSVTQGAYRVAPAP